VRPVYYLKYKADISMFQLPAVQIQKMFIPIPKKDNDNILQRPIREKACTND
jgi:hypothetical protein